MGEESHGLKANRGRIGLKPNDYVLFKDDIFKITQPIDFETVVGINVKTSQSLVLPISQLSTIEGDESHSINHQDLEEITDKEWSKIERRFDAIRPLVDGATRKEVECRAIEVGRHYTTIYRWLRKYRSMMVKTALIAKRPGCIPGTKRISPEAESIITEVIESHYLSSQRPSIQRVIDRVFIACHERKVLPPGKNTIRSRIKEISEYERLKRQGNKSKARTLYEPTPGKFPGADYPLAVVQIDHTPMDIMLVDDEHRLSIGRPWITLAIDQFSRMVTGYYLSLDAPSAASVAMCLANSMLPKDKWLAAHEVNGEWPVWGVMNTIHVDNGADFQSGTFKRSCLEYGIHVKFRPVTKTNYGGTIERMLGTILKHVHDIPGTTFSNIKERDSYDSDGKASMTFSEFEKWLITYITAYYHKKVHRSLDVSPEDKWNIGIFGGPKSDGIGLPPKLVDGETVLISFMPIFDRTIQKNGVNIDGLTYYENILRSLVNVVDNKTGKKRGFIFRRDPRDVSYIWFYEPSSQSYYKLPLANQAIPPMSLGEYNTVKEQIKDKGVPRSDYEIIEVLADMNRQVETAQKKSKKARRSAQRKKVHKKAGPIVEKKPNVVISDEDDFWGDEVEAFD